ncbi:MAG: tRNA pseudouridine(38-40) synthase TruA [Planctomycetia bacterium]|nr:tRNA pseudouridine(38-40) synthase TruA [Planctomycetia bacterium]
MQQPQPDSPSPPPRRTLKLTVSYDGTEFYGWQIQPTRRTVQGLLEEALSDLCGEDVKVVGSGRTDTGVHALAQVASIETACPLDGTTLRKALNARLPVDVAIVDVQEARAGFHAIDHALGKRYRYVIHDGPAPDVFRRRTCWKVRHRLDVSAMHAAGQALVGKHDFASFEGAGSRRVSSVRTVKCLAVSRPPGEADLIHIEVEADGFLYTMVRIIAGVLYDVGRGFRDIDWPASVLAAKDRRLSGRTAPARGLVLVRVEYDAAWFELIEGMGSLAGRPPESRDSKA